MSWQIIKIAAAVWVFLIVFIAANISITKIFVRFFDNTVRELFAWLDLLVFYIIPERISRCKTAKPKTEKISDGFVGKTCSAETNGRENGSVELTKTK